MKSKKKRDTKLIVLKALLFGLLILPWAVISAYNDRGYMAYGGEWLTPLLCVLCALMFATMKDIFENYKKMYGRKNNAK